MCAKCGRCVSVFGYTTIACTHLRVFLVQAQRSGVVQLIVELPLFRVLERLDDGVRQLAVLFLPAAALLSLPSTPHVQREPTHTHAYTHMHESGEKNQRLLLILMSSRPTDCVKPHPDRVYGQGDRTPVTFGLIYRIWEHYTVHTILSKLIPNIRRWSGFGTLRLFGQGSHGSQIARNVSV